MEPASSTSSAKPGTSVTFEQWANLLEDEPGEWVEGHIEDEELPTVVHEFVVSWLLSALAPWVRSRQGYIFGSELKLRVSPTRGRKPDVSIFLKALPGKAHAVDVAPAVIIEVVTDRPRDARRDRVEKMAEYAGLGAQHYWIIDPQLRTLELCQLGSAGRYEHILGASAGRVTIPGFTDLEVDLDDLWRQVAALEAVEG